MRNRAAENGISVHAIAGTYVVLLGLDVDEDKTDGLVGFTIYRDSPDQTTKLLGGRMYFPGIQDAASINRSDTAPIQAFLWGDYEAQPGTTYTYRVVSQYGEPGKLKAEGGVSVTVTTEQAEAGTHSIYFNRGVAGSRAYANNFGDHRRWYLVDVNGRIQPTEWIKPECVPNHEADQWLSRGLEEAMLNFIAQADGPEYSLRAAVYEFTHVPAIQAFVDALERGVDVKIVHHAKREHVMQLKTQRDPKDGTDDWGMVTTTTWEPQKHAAKSYKNKYLQSEEVKDAVCQAAEVAVARVGLKDAKYLKAFAKLLIERKNTTISHNKFIVLLKKNRPIQVWTGSTNFTAGGIFGQSNVGHAVRDPRIARKYYAYWKMLAKDPSKAQMTAWTAKNTPDLTKDPPKNSVTPIFSPRKTKKMLDWYAERIPTAKNAVFFTAAFSVDSRFLTQFGKTVRPKDGAPYQRYIMLESQKGPMRARFEELAKTDQNRIAWGALAASVRGSHTDASLERDAKSEVLTGLNDHVSFVHTKYLIIDPLSDDPLVCTGSANFSENSTTANDENMLVIRGDKRVAEIFLGEFMRLFVHFRNRNERNQLLPSDRERAQELQKDDRWVKDYFQPGTWQQQERLLFR
jgi:phosphatidylserine/phosphatidylglycerophosphate/cardiolipin synthase-like enzyme